MAASNFSIAHGIISTLLKTDNLQELTKQMTDSDDEIRLDSFIDLEGSELSLDLVELAQGFDPGGIVGHVGVKENAQSGSAVSGFFQFIAVIAGIAILTVILRQPTDAVRMRQDLHRITMEIEKADIRLEQKEHLLDEIDAIRRGLHAGASIPAASWLEARESIESLLQGGITDDKFRLIEREFDRITNEIYETNQ
jgi:hypothetical protein